MKIKSRIALPALFVVSSLVLASCSSTTTMSGMGGMNHGNQQSSVSGDAVVGTDANVPDEAVSSNGKLEVTLTAAESQVPFRDSTRWAMTYNGKVQGPTIRIHPGDQLTINLVNNLSKPTSLHTHGLHVDPAVDDPFLMVEPGQTHTFVYDIPANQQAGTFWYHPHVHQLTAEQVASGLSGAIVVENTTDTSLSSTTTDRTLVINDPLLVTENPWTGGGQGGMGNMGGMNHGNQPSAAATSDTTYGRGINMMQSMMGRTGQLVLANGFEGVNFSNNDGKLERLRLVNATSSTQLKFTYEGQELLQLSTGGGRLAAPHKIESITLGPGDRAEVVLIPNADGGKIFALRVPNEQDVNLNTTPELIAQISASAGTDVTALPVLDANTRDLFASDVKVDATRTITLDGHMNPKIDGKLFDPSVVNVTAKRGTIEEWVIKSNSPMSHPFHLHTWGFQIQGQTGWHDEVTVEPYKSATIRVSFDDYSGTTVLHCHILDHEDTGMMATIQVN